MFDKGLAQKIFAAGKIKGFQDMEVFYSSGTSFSVKIYKGEIDDYKLSGNEGISLRGKKGSKMGYSYSEKVDESSVDILIHEAMQNAEIIESKDEEYIFEGAENYRQINNYNTELEKVTEREKIDFALNMEKYAFEADSRVYSVQYCLYGEGSGQMSLINTYGLELSQKDNVSYAYLAVLVKEDDEIRSGSSYRVTSDFYSLDPKKIAEEAVKEAVEKLGSKSIKSGKYKVLLKNTAAADLIESYCGIFSAENIQKDLSLLKGKLGQKIASDKLTIKDNPFMEKGFAASGFDGEGYPCSEKAIIEKGVLKTYLYNLKTAKKDGVESTGNASKKSYKSTVGILPTNFYIEQGEKSFGELLESVSEGILITEIEGLHAGINTVSGDFSLSAGGFYVENGEKIFPVTQITISGNFFELIKRIEEVGNDIKFGMPGAMYVGAPTLKIRDVDVAGE